MTAVEAVVEKQALATYSNQTALNLLLNLFAVVILDQQHPL